MKILVAGGAGFLGSHLCDALMARGDDVICLDNLSTGRLANVAHLAASSQFHFINADLVAGVDLNTKIDIVFHLASPASPRDYHERPLETLAVGSVGTTHALRLALRDGARFVLASTSEIYGDPALHPQPEHYWGNVNPVGPRSVYDEAKRFAEATTAAYRASRAVDTGIVRIFNTYGPRMKADDGRVVSNFITQALNGDPLTIYGDGRQTRSFCYVDDLVRGLVAMGDDHTPGPLNLGNPEELTVEELARLVLTCTGSASTLDFRALPVDDPARRSPVVSHAWQTLSWRPEMSVAEGVQRTVAWFRSVPDEVRAAARAKSDERRPANAG